MLMILIIIVLSSLLSWCKNTKKIQVSKKYSTSWNTISISGNISSLWLKTAKMSINTSTKKFPSTNNMSNLWSKPNSRNLSYHTACGGSIVKFQTIFPVLKIHSSLKLSSIPSFNPLSKRNYSLLKPRSTIILENLLSIYMTTSSSSTKRRNNSTSSGTVRTLTFEESEKNWNKAWKRTKI